MSTGDGPRFVERTRGELKTQTAQGVEAQSELEANTLAINRLEDTMERVQQQLAKITGATLAPYERWFE